MSFKIMLVCLSLTFSLSAQAQLGSLLKGVLGDNSQETTTSQSTSTTSSTVQGLTSVFKNLIGMTSVSNNSLKGDWSYENPAVVFESDNLLKKAGGSMMTGTAEKTLQKYLSKIGFVPGKVELSFDGDKSFTMKIGSRNISGTYSINDNEITLERKGLINRPITANLSVVGSEMQITFKADKLLEFMTKIASMTNNSTLNMIGNLASGYDGMQLGFQFKRK